MLGPFIGVMLGLRLLAALPSCVETDLPLGIAGRLVENA
jgi:hypothetical protein